MRKSSVTNKSSLPSGAFSRQVTSRGFLPFDSPRSFPSTPWDVPNKCLSMYSCPLPDDPRRLERQMKRLRGKLRGSSGSSQDNRREPAFRRSTTYCFVS